MARTDNDIRSEIAEVEVALRRLQSIPALIPVAGQGSVDLSPASDYLRSRLARLQIELDGPRGGFHSGPWMAGR